MGRGHPSRATLGPVAPALVEDSPHRIHTAGPISHACHARGFQLLHLLPRPCHFLVLLVRFFVFIVAIPRDVRWRNVSLKIRKHLMTSETEKKARPGPAAGSFCGHPALCSTEISDSFHA